MDVAADTPGVTGREPRRSAELGVVRDSIIQVGADGYVDFYNSSGGTVSLVVDASGYFVPQTADDYTSITPDRFLDTRQGTGG